MANLDDSLEQMVDLLLIYEELPFLDLVQEVWRRGWTLSSANEPKDSDPLRRALKACLVERMVEIWNSPPKNASESVPDWCESIPAVETRFSVIRPSERELWEHELCSPVFDRRNIFAPREFMFFL